MYPRVSFYLEYILIALVLSDRQLWRLCSYLSDKCLAVKSRVTFRRSFSSMDCTKSLTSGALQDGYTHNLVFSQHSSAAQNVHPALMVILTVKNLQSKLWSVALDAHLLPNACEVKVQ